MRREDRVVLFVLGIVLGSAVAFLYVTWFLVPFFLFLPTGMVLSTAIVGGLFLVRFRIGTVQAPASDVLRYLAHEFRIKGYRVTEEPGHLQIRLGSSMAMKVHVATSADAAEVKYQTDATRSGWANLIILILLDWTALVAIVAGVYVFLRVRSFAARFLIPLVPIDASLPSRPQEDPVRTVLVDALSEGHRLAAEAQEAERSTFWNLELILITSGFILWALVLVAFFFASSSPSFAGWTQILVATILAGAFVALGSVRLRARFHPRLVAHRAWAERLSRALAREARRGAPEGGESSAFELLAEASSHVPEWIEARRGAGILDDPGSGTLFVMIFVLGLVAFVVTGWAVLTGQIALAALSGLVGVGLSVGAELYHRSWKRDQEEAFARTGREWERRIASLRARLDRFLQDL